MNSALKAATHVFNPLALPVARLGVIPLWGVVRHRGRKSGRMFATPIAVAATSDAFVIPLPWGERTDWCRNIVAAGGGTIRYRGSDYLVRDPQVVSVDVARSAFPAPIRAILPLTGIQRFLRVARA